jgi:hypothetical protein
MFCGFPVQQRLDCRHDILDREPELLLQSLPGYLRGGQFRRREIDSDWLAISRASFNFTSYLSAIK